MDNQNQYMINALNKLLTFLLLKFSGNKIFGH